MKILIKYCDTLYIWAPLLNFKGNGTPYSLILLYISIQDFPGTLYRPVVEPPATMVLLWKRNPGSGSATRPRIFPPSTM